ncbi:MAG TPA: hypothetical protein VFX35_11905 [Solirubrobacterales bacterium]|nr:hypothetical protein [Solirubrobacterales bacterium]
MTRAAHYKARAAADAALASTEPPAQVAEKFEVAAASSEAAVPDEELGTTAVRWRSHRELLRIAAALQRWDAGVQAAEADAERHLNSARRRAELLRDRLLERPDPDREADLVGLAEMAARVSSHDETEAFGRRLREAPLPASLIRSKRKGRGGHAASQQPEARETPRAVVLLLLDDDSIGDTVRVQLDRFHRLRALVRIIAWPAELPRLTLRFDTVWDPATIEVPPVTLLRPETGDSDPLPVEGEVQLVLRASGDEPVNLTIAASLSADGGEETEIAVLGQRRLAVRALDPALDSITGAEAIDERLHDAFTFLREKVSKEELEAFARLFAAVARAAMAIQIENVFREGAAVPESEFQSEMERRLRADATLGGRLTRTDSAGGRTDLVHDGINCELKVERQHAVSLDVARAYLGQPVQYASGGQRQLSLLCILDMSAKDLPPGILANNVALIEPDLHGAPKPMRPSWVGVVVIPGNLPIPSAWSRTKVPGAEIAKPD